MGTLAEILLAPHRREAVEADALRLVEQHVEQRGGLRGMSLKTGLAMLKTAKPGILNRGVRQLLPEFARALDPLYQAFRASPDRDFSVFLGRHRDDATAALLAVADARAARAAPGIRSAYARLRGIAADEVGTVLPALARMIQSRLD